MAALKRVEAGLSVPEICRELSISTAKVYKWRAKFGGVDTSMMARMEELEDENRRLKKRYLEKKPKCEIVAEALAKNGEAVSPTRDGPTCSSNAQHPIRVACATFMVSESCYRYECKQNAEKEEIASWLIRLTDNHRNWGFGRCYLYLSNVKGFGWNHKRVYRIYWELELKLRIKPRKRLVREKPEPLALPQAIIQIWSMDFMHNKLEDGRNLQLFNVIDAFNRKALVIEVNFSLPSDRVIRTLKQIIAWRGKPQQNAYVERFNRTVRYEWLSQYYWSSIEEVQDFATQWLWCYKNDRSNMALGCFTPKQHLAMTA